MKAKLHSLISAIALAGFTFATLPASAATYEIDPAHTFVVFEATHLGIGKAYGMFRKTTGSYDPDAGKLDVTIDANSVYSANKKRDDHLRGPDFFNAKQFPTITFKSTEVKTAGDQIKIMGNLTMKGTTKPVELVMKKVGEGKDPWGNFRTGYEGSLTVNRMDFGIDYMPEGLSKDITLRLAVEGIRQ
jgi:polyisoprenoid-binding protein YceI